MKKALYRLWSIVIIPLFTLSAQAQPIPNTPVIDPSALPIEPLEPLPELPPQPDEPLELDRPPSVSTPEDSPPVLFFVEDIQVVGNTLFDTEIKALVEPLEGREITFDALLELRTRITRLYLDNGYISSGAFIPINQILNDGIVQIQIVEGYVEQIQINGLTRLRESYVRDRLTRAIEPPLNVQRLEEVLQILQVDPLLQNVDAELTAGSRPGQNLLILDLVEAEPFVANFRTNNYRAPSIGSHQGNATVSHLNILGFGDRLSLGYALTEGLNSYDVSYTIPVNSSDGTLQLRYDNARSEIVTSQFRDAGIRSNSETFSVNFRQPLARSLTSEFALSFGFDFRDSRSFILDDIPFSFSIGPENGVSRVRALRLAQEWVNRDVNSVIAARSQFSFGLDIFDATVNTTGTDGHFFAWLGQFQWVEQLSPQTLLVTRINAQLTPDSLLPLERFSVGGIDTVRGYIQNQIVTDNAITASTEFRFPIANDLQLAPFIDAGGGWNNQSPNPDPAFLLSLGLGLRWQPADGLDVRLDYGLPLISPEDEGSSLQEDGFHFSVNLQPF
ncbi:MAG: ShlB/FhaC/HecB family hemolysin secretion/activation protein [Leptolyngbya sp. SIO4C5]|nr:ShlB/FhaC/HecB family hemolysin secretion/activation protein [Leptolyngbya sp. SIO4C5]